MQETHKRLMGSNLSLEQQNVCKNGRDSAGFTPLTGERKNHSEFFIGKLMPESRWNRVFEMDRP